jgi:hypothetical protein
MVHVYLLGGWKGKDIITWYRDDLPMDRDIYSKITVICPFISLPDYCPSLRGCTRQV